jgi:hypothetical protein
MQPDLTGQAAFFSFNSQNQFPHLFIAGESALFNSRNKINKQTLSFFPDLVLILLRANFTKVKDAKPRA